MPAALRNATQDGQFASTRWTVVLDAGASAVSSARSLDALSELCRIYFLTFLYSRIDNTRLNFKLAIPEVLQVEKF
jgi:hypothetical protein